MREHCADSRFFGMRAADHGNFNCIGIATKTRNFYLCDEMEAAIAIVSDIARTFTRVIVIGHSMGGYAALKYSRALGADRVVAFSPNYSLDGEELDLPTDAHRKILERSVKQFGIVPNAAYKGMGIVPEDCSGKLSIIYDPQENIDNWYIDIFKKRITGCDYIPFEGSGHDLGTGLEEGDTIVRLVQALEADELDQARRVLGSIQRTSAHFIALSLARAVHRHPLLCFRAMSCQRVKGHKDYQRIISERFNGSLVYRLVECGFRNEAYEHMLATFRIFFSFKPNDVVDLADLTLTNMVKEFPCLLLSKQGQYLVFDAKIQKLRFCNYFTPQQSIYPVTLQMRGSEPELNIATAAGAVPAVLTAPQHGDSSTVGDPSIKVGFENGSLTILTAAGYLMGRDEIEFSTEQQPTPDEMFIPMPLKPDSTLLKASSAGWFDQKLIAPVEPPKGRTRTKGRFELFRIFRNQSEHV